MFTYHPNDPNIYIEQINRREFLVTDMDSGYPRCHIFTKKMGLKIIEHIINRRSTSNTEAFSTFKYEWVYKVIKGY